MNTYLVVMRNPRTGSAVQRCVLGWDRVHAALKTWRSLNLSRSPAIKIVETGSYLLDGVEVQSNLL